MDHQAIRLGRKCLKPLGHLILPAHLLVITNQAKLTAKIPKRPMVTLIPRNIPFGNWVD